MAKELRLTAVQVHVRAREFEALHTATLDMRDEDLLAAMEAIIEGRPQMSSFYLRQFAQRMDRHADQLERHPR